MENEKSTVKVPVDSFLHHMSNLCSCRDTCSQTRITSGTTRLNLYDLCGIYLAANLMSVSVLVHYGVYKYKKMHGKVISKKESCRSSVRVE